MLLKKFYNMPSSHVSCSVASPAQLISFEIESISKEINWAEQECMNICPHDRSGDATDLAGRPISYRTFWFVKHKRDLSGIPKNHVLILRKKNLLKENLILKENFLK